MNKHAFKLFIAKNFAKALQEKFTVYILIICNIIEKLTVEHQVKVMNNTISHITNALETQILVFELKKYEDVFLIESINKLFLYKEHDHAIKITAKLSYDLLYNLLNTELMTLKQYLNYILAKE
jgi:hypothetical protein